MRATAITHLDRSAQRTGERALLGLRDHHHRPVEQERLDQRHVDERFQVVGVHDMSRPQLAAATRRIDREGV
ncbi:MAG: hypothetical protein WCI22_16545 [Actinomycetota bacterium]